VAKVLEKEIRERLLAGASDLAKPRTTPTTE
jgi:hypothetical protein